MQGIRMCGVGRRVAAFTLWLFCAAALQTLSPARTSQDTQSTKSSRSKKAKQSAGDATSSQTAAPAAPTAAAAQASKAHGTAKSASTTDIQAARSSGKVWVNTESGVYHKSGEWYGTTKKGKFMSEPDAIKAGYKAAKNEK